MNESNISRCSSQICRLQISCAGQPFALHRNASAKSPCMILEMCCQSGRDPRAGTHPVQRPDLSGVTQSLHRVR